MAGKKRVFVWNVPFDCAENDLAECARTYGSIRHVFLPENKTCKGRVGAINSGYGYVEFSQDAMASKFVEAATNGEVTMGDGEQMRAIRAELAKTKKAKKNKKDDKNHEPVLPVDLGPLDKPFDWNLGEKSAASAANKEPDPQPSEDCSTSAVKMEVAKSEPHSAEAGSEIKLSDDMADMIKTKKAKKNKEDDKKHALSPPVNPVPSDQHEKCAVSATKKEPDPQPSENSSTSAVKMEIAAENSHDHAQQMEIVKTTSEPQGDPSSGGGGVILQRLPAELWSRLLSYIDLPNLMRLKLVNRQMSRIVDTTIRNMLTLDLSSPPEVHLFRNTNTFAVKFVYVDHSLVSKIFSKSNNWQSLRRFNLNSDKVRITPKTVKLLATRLRTLEDLSICCNRVVNECFRKLFLKNRMIRRLNLNARSGSLSLLAIRTLLRSCRSLTHLTMDLSKIKFDFGTEVIDVGNLESISALSSRLFAKKSQQMRFLNCKMKAEDSSKFELLICATFPTLTTAHLTTIPSTAMTCLRQLVLPRLPVGVDVSIWNRLPCLESLIVAASDPVRPSGADLGFLASPNCHVSEISLRNCGIRDTDLMYLQRMKRIDLRDNCALSDDNIKTFLNSNPNVEALGLRGLCEISGGLLRFIGSSCSRLKWLNIADCPKIDNEAIQCAASTRTPAQRSPITVIAPGCKIDTDQSFINMMKTRGVLLFCNWGDICKIPIVAHLEPGAISNVLEEEWPLSCRSCGTHRLNQNIILEDFDDFDIDDEDNVVDDDGDGFDEYVPSDFEDDDDVNDPDEWDELNG